MILLALKLSFLEIIGFLSAFLVGISLGLLGSGGSALAMPVLIYIFKINEKYPISEMLFKKGFYIPSGIGNTLKEINRVSKIIIDIFSKQKL